MTFLRFCIFAGLLEIFFVAEVETSSEPDPVAVQVENLEEPVFDAVAEGADGNMALPVEVQQMLTALTDQLRALGMDPRKGQPFYKLHEIEPLRGDLKEDVQKYFVHFEYLASLVPNIDDAAKLAELKKCLRDKALVVFQAATDAQNDTFEHAKAYLLERLTQPHQRAVYRHDFHSKKKGTDSVADFYRELCRLADLAYSDSSADAKVLVIKERLIDGSAPLSDKDPNKKIWKAAYTNAGGSFEDVLRAMQAAETTQKSLSLVSVIASGASANDLTAAMQQMFASENGQQHRGGRGGFRGGYGRGGFGKSRWMHSNANSRGSRGRGRYNSQGGFGDRGGFRGGRGTNGNSNRGGNRSRSSGCFECGALDHWRNECPKYLEKRKDAEVNNFDPSQDASQEAGSSFSRGGGNQFSGGNRYFRGNRGNRGGRGNRSRGAGNSGRGGQNFYGEGQDEHHEYPQKEGTEGYGDYQHWLLEDVDFLIEIENQTKSGLESSGKKQHLVPFQETPGLVRDSSPEQRVRPERNGGLNVRNLESSNQRNGNGVNSAKDPLVSEFCFNCKLNNNAGSFSDGSAGGSVGTRCFGRRRDGRRRRRGHRRSLSMERRQQQSVRSYRNGFLEYLLLFHLRGLCPRWET